MFKWIMDLFKTPVVKLACPCCDHLTLTQRGTFEVCPVCFWEDDESSAQTPDAASATNHGYSLTLARNNFQAFGAMSRRLKRYTRAPKPDEIP